MSRSPVPWILIGAVAVGAAAVLLVLSLRGGDTGREVAPDAALADQCDDVPQEARRLTLTAADGRALGGALVGDQDAATGLVVRQGASQTICAWLPLAGRIAEETGVRVLLFDRRGSGSSPGGPDLASEPADTITAVDWLRDHGAAQVALMGSSMGNAVVFSALPDLDPAPCAVLSVSPVLAAGPLDAVAPRAVPGNVWVTWETGSAGVADSAERIASASGAARTLPVDTEDHSIGLVDRHAEVADFLVEAAASCEAGS